MVKTERELREDICQVGRLVFQKGWVAANDGNISIRLDAERILATPTGVCKGMMQPDDLIIVDTKGNKISGRAERTIELLKEYEIFGGILFSFLSNAVVNGRFALRACIVNFRTSLVDIEALPPLLSRLGKDVCRESVVGPGFSSDRT